MSVDLCHAGSRHIILDYVCFGLFRFLTLRSKDTAGIVLGCEVKNKWRYTSAYPTCLRFLGTNKFTFTLRYAVQAEKH